MSKRGRRARARRDVAKALRPYTKRALLWQTLGKVDLSGFIKAAPAPEKIPPK